jgi:hypothetical protein
MLSTEQTSIKCCHSVAENSLQLRRGFVEQVFPPMDSRPEFLRYFPFPHIKINNNLIFILLPIRKSKFRGDSSYVLSCTARTNQTAAHTVALFSSPTRINTEPAILKYILPGRVFGGELKNILKYLWGDVEFLAS